MKNFILMAVAGMLALSSCSSDDKDSSEQIVPRQMTFTASYGNVAKTRATMDFLTNKVSFDANDEISILSTKNTNTKFTTTAGGASATFSGTAVDDTKFYAVYPYTTGLALSGNVISGIKIPTSQWNDLWADYDKNSSWDPKAPIAYAFTTSSNLTFRSLCAILKINAKGGWMGSIEISADQNLAGTFSLDTSTGTLTATAGSKTVTIGKSVKEIKAFDEYLYIAIAPGSYTNFKVRAQWMDYIDEKTEASITFTAGKIYDMGTFYPLP